MEKGHGGSVSTGPDSSRPGQPSKSPHTVVVQASFLGQVRAHVCMNRHGSHKNTRGGCFFNGQKDYPWHPDAWEEASVVDLCPNACGTTCVTVYVTV